MKVARLRVRRTDPLASANGGGNVVENSGSSLPGLIPRLHKNLVSLLNPLRGLYMASAVWV